MFVITDCSTMTTNEDLEIPSDEVVNIIRSTDDKQEVQKKRTNSPKFIPPDLPNFEEISEDDEDYQKKFDATCERIREFFLTNFSKAFSDEISEETFADVEPISIK